MWMIWRQYHWVRVCVRGLLARSAYDCSSTELWTLKVVRFLFACWQVLHLQGKSLRHLDVGGCSNLHELQMSRLERPVADLMAAARSGKVIP